MSEQTGAAASHDEVLSRIGHLTRTLHDSLRALGLDKLIERAACDIPDARDRLDYVARLSEQAAQKVLNATDAANPMQDAIDQRSGDIAARWQALLDGGQEGDWRALAAASIAQLQANQRDAAATRQHLMDIMMAQDFQDLTGQVISRVTALAQNLETQLVELLVDFAPAEVKREYDNGLMNGPQINPEANADVVANQGQVDDLLESLGF
ncbi:protein phosphatase CheZ [Massilia terrae]|uniref:Protein phosphatase CheZ n=1 Tax=Massilia terrae TaxID=1811224 RepID=A0ABT2CS86_9BURK|nr:protein phosphatase CheZ [Massilia terrae]MCS0656689.1 protein phosphatase CheZ [Massilia terrae]